METVAIAGVGLIGGSFALALRKAGFGGRLLGVSSASTTKKALARGVIDEALPLEEALPRADLAFLSQPIARILEILPGLDRHLKPGSLVTDAGSTKARIAEIGRRTITRALFLGGHPMAGKETRGVEEADAELFRGRTWVLTPDGPDVLEMPQVREFVHWIRRIGAVPVALAPAEHDRVVALTSHLPQLASTALASALSGRVTAPTHLRTAGPGLLDLTRLALSSYDIWGDILHTNAQAIGEALGLYIERLKELRDVLESDRMRDEFSAAADFARRLRGRET